MFIWEKEIKSVKDWLVEYTDWTKEQFSNEYAEYFTTKELKTLDEFYQYKTHKIIADTMKILIDTNSKMSEIQAVYDWLISSIEHAKDEAICKLMWVEHSKDISFKTINDIVIKK